MRKKAAKALRKKAGKLVSVNLGVATSNNFVKTYKKLKRTYKDHKQGK